MGNKENSIYQFYLNLSNLNRYNLGKHLWRNKEWKRDKSNTSKIHFEDKCVLLVCSAKFRKMRTRIYSAEWRIASKRRKRKKKNQTEATSSSGTETRSIGETGRTLFTDTNSSNESHERFDDEPITILS